MGSNNDGRGASSRVAGVLAFVVGAFVLFAAIGGCPSQESPPPAASQEINMKTVIIPIEGMSCSACAARVRKTLTSIDGVSGVEVNLAERNARVRFDPSKLSPDRLVSAVNGLGYHASTPTEAK